MAFTFTLNQAPADWAAAMLQLKSLLVAGGWVVMASGDGTGGTYSPAGDCLNNATPGTKALAGSIANSNMWFRIQAPNGRELLFKRSSTTGGSNEIDDCFIRYSPTAFDQTGDGALSATVAPTSANEMIVLGAQRTGSSGQLWAGSLGVLTQKWDFAIGGAAEDYAFYGIGRTSPGGVYVGGIMYDVVTSPRVGDVNPEIVSCLGGSSSVFFGVTDSRITAKATNAQLKGGATTGITLRHPWGYQLDHAAETFAVGFVIQKLAYIQANVSSNPGTTGVNPYDGNVDLIQPCTYMSLKFTSTLGAVTTPRGIRKGVSQLVVGLSTTGAGTAMDTNTALTAIYQQPGLWLLWDGSTAPAL